MRGIVRQSTVQAMLAIGLVAATPASAEPPLLREIASTTISSGYPLGVSPSADGSVHVLAEDSMTESGSDFDPRGKALPYLLKIDRAGVMSPKVELPRLSHEGKPEPYMDASFPRGKARFTVLPSGGMLAIGSSSIGLFDAQGKLL
jgi:hypothetical protein